MLHCRRLLRVIIELAKALVFICDAEIAQLSMVKRSSLILLKS